LPRFFDIEVNGSFIDLSDASVRLEKVNPAFISDLYQGNYSFPFNAPATEKNLKTFGFANYIDVSNRVTDYDCYVYLFGIPYQKAKLRITKGKKRSFSIVVSEGIKALKNADKKLSEIDLGDDIILGTTPTTKGGAVFNIASNQNWANSPITFVPFYAPGFYDGNNSDFNGVVNRQDSVNGAFYTNTITSGNNECLVPFIYFFWLLNRIFELEGLTPGGSFWSNPEYSKLLLFNNLALDAGTEDSNTFVKPASQYTYNAFSDISFQLGPEGTYDNLQAWQAPQYIIKKTGLYQFDFFLDIIMYQVPGQTNYAIQFGVQYDSQVPVSVWFDTSTQVFSKNFSLTINAGPGDVGKYVVLTYLKNNIAVTVPNPLFAVKTSSYVLVTELSSTPINTHADRVILKNHMPDWTVGEFLKEVKNLGVNFDFDFMNGKVNMDTVKNLLEDSTVEDWTGNAAPDYEMSLEEKGNGFTVEYEFNDTETIVKKDESRFIGEYITRSDFPSPTSKYQQAIAKDTNTIYQVTDSGAQVWTSQGFNYSPHIIGRGTSGHKCKLAPMMMANANLTGGTADQNSALLPYMPGKGSSPMFGIGLNNNFFRLVFLRGENQIGPVPVQKGGVYLYASTGIYGINKNIVGNYSFRLDNTTGILRRNIDKLYTAINEGALVEKELFLDAKQVLTVKASSKRMIDYNLYFIKSLSISIRNKISKVKAILLKL